MKRTALALALALTTLPLAPATATSPEEMTVAFNAQGAYDDVPLVVIRFNQRKVYYERQLYNAISKAVEIKPSVVFDVVSFIPQTSNESRNERYMEDAQIDKSKVIKSLVGMGIPRERLRVSNQKAPNIRHHEMHIYVE